MSEEKPKTPEQLAASIVPPGDKLVFFTIVPPDERDLGGLPCSGITTCGCIRGSFGKQLRYTIAAAIEEYGEWVKEQDWR